LYQFLVSKPTDTLADTGNLDALRAEALRSPRSRFIQAGRSYALSKGKGIITWELNAELLDSDHPWAIFAAAQTAVKDETRPKCTTLGLLRNFII
jgi:hypothetical protein